MEDFQSSQRLSNLIQLGSFATGLQITQRTNAREMIFGAENIQSWEVHVLHQLRLGGTFSPGS